jgi:hypothetical protein
MALAGLLLTLASVAAVTTPSSAVTTGPDEGCTPGYWKTHTSAWEEYAPTDPVHILLGASNAALFGPYANDTLATALSYSGGPGLDGARRILLRAAVASWLNAAHDSVGFPLRRDGLGFNGEPSLRDQLTAALSSNDRDTMLALATSLDGYNNLGCPL